MSQFIPERTELWTIVREGDFENSESARVLGWHRHPDGDPETGLNLHPVVLWGHNVSDIRCVDCVWAPEQIIHTHGQYPSRDAAEAALEELLDHHLRLKSLASRDDPASAPSA